MTDKNKFTLTVCSIIILAAIFTELMAFINDGRNDMDFSSSAIGFVGYIGLFFHSQEILNKNQFKTFGLIGLLIFLVCTIKQSIIGYQQFPLFVAALPFQYIVFFRVMTALFYKEYPKTIPTIVFATKTGLSSFQGDDQGYKPTMKEKFFSLILFFGFMATAFILIFLINKLIQ